MAKSFSRKYLRPHTLRKPMKAGYFFPETGVGVPESSGILHRATLQTSRASVRIAMAEFTTLIDGLSFTESPRWRDGRLYVSDRHTHRVLAIAKDGTTETIAYDPERLLCGLGFLPDGRLLITSMLDRKILRREHDGSLVEHADLSALAQHELNDMLVDR